MKRKMRHTKTSKQSAGEDEEIAETLRDELGDDYELVVEGDHIHVEYDLD